MDAKISETVGGFKGVLLKVIDPLFKGENGGSDIPIQISGSRNNPTFGLDKGRIFKARRQYRIAATPRRGARAPSPRRATTGRS